PRARGARGYCQVLLAGRGAPLHARWARAAPPGSQGVSLRGLIRVVLVLWLLVAGAAVAAAAAERNPVAHAPRAPARLGSLERLIVRLRAAPTGAAVHSRLASLATRSELSLESSRAISGDMHALRVRLAPGASLADTLARLRQDPQVAYAEL